MTYGDGFSHVAVFFEQGSTTDFAIRLAAWSNELNEQPRGFALRNRRGSWRADVRGRVNYVVRALTRRLTAFGSPRTVVSRTRKRRCTLLSAAPRRLRVRRTANCSSGTRKR